MLTVCLYIYSIYSSFQIRERAADASPLSSDQIAVLESVRFAFTTRGEEHWQKSYEKLKEYKEEHGHVLVPRQCEIPGLGDWVSGKARRVTPICCLLGFWVSCCPLCESHMVKTFEFEIATRNIEGYQPASAIPGFQGRQANAPYEATQRFAR